MPFLFRRRHVHVHGLDRHAARPGKAVPDNLSGAGEQACAQPLELRVHAHAQVL